MGVKVKKFKIKKAYKAINSFSLLDQVKTPHGVGIIVEAGGMDPNGLYFTVERAKFLVWYGCESDIASWPEHVPGLGRRLSWWYKADELEKLN
jgi:hypothetical protein